MAANGDLSQTENSTSDHGKNSPNPNMQQASKLPQYGRIKLDISNSVLPLEKLNNTPSGKDGLSEDMEQQVRSFGCELIQLGGKLLRLPQVAMATGCVLFQRFYYAKSLVRIPFDHVSMACLCLASKIEEAPRRIRDIINVFHHIKQIRGSKKITPVVLDHNYLALKNNVIKAERRVLKELGFCVHVKHPHKIIVMYLTWLTMQENKELVQMAWNFMNDSLRTDVFVRYPPETIAVACIYLSARKLKVPLPKNPSWFDVLGVEEDDIKDCCYRMICLYNQTKANQEDLEATIEGLRKKMDEERRAKLSSAMHTPVQSSPASRAGSPAKTATGEQPQSQNHHEAKSEDRHEAKNNGRGEENFDHHGDHELSPRHYRKKHKHKREPSRSRSPSYDDYRHNRHGSHRSSRDRKKAKKHSRQVSRSPSYSPAKKRKHHHKDKMRYRSPRSPRDRDHGGRRGGCASIGLHDSAPKHRDSRDHRYERSKNYSSRR